MRWYIKIYRPDMKYTGMALWPFMFLNKNHGEYTINHEEIHFKQQLELLIIPFYLLYVIFHIIYGYRKNPFECEGWELREMPHKRKCYGWVKYLTKGRKKI